MLADTARRGFQITQIGRAVRTGRRAYRDEDHIRGWYGVGVARGETEIGSRVSHEIFHVRLVKWDFAPFERLDLAFVGIDTRHFVSQKG